MADPNATAVDQQPDSNQLKESLTGIDASLDPKITTELETAHTDEQKAVTESERAASLQEDMSRTDTGQDPELDQWLKQTPTRQASYANAMHVAPILALLTAIGGKITGASGQSMLAATNGIIQGINAGAEKAYEDNYNRWMAQYQKLKDHHTALMQSHKLMLEAYQGRADAYQKAADAARRMTGDLITEKQRKVAETIDSFKAQSAAMDKLTRARESMEMNHARIQHMLKQESHWKELETKAARDPKIAQQQKQLHERWLNYKAQVDEAMKQRGQVNSSLDMSAADKAASMAQIDSEIRALEMAMDQTEASGDALVSAPQVPPENTVAPPQANRGTITRLSPGKLQALKKTPGQAVTFADGTVAIMDQNGSVQVLSTPQGSPTAQ